MTFRQGHCAFDHVRVNLDNLILVLPISAKVGCCPSSIDQGKGASPNSAEECSDQLWSGQLHHIKLVSIRRVYQVENPCSASLQHISLNDRTSVKVIDGHSTPLFD